MSLSRCPYPQSIFQHHYPPFPSKELPLQPLKTTCIFLTKHIHNSWFLWFLVFFLLEMPVPLLLHFEMYNLFISSLISTHATKTSSGFTFLMKPPKTVVHLSHNTQQHSDYLLFILFSMIVGSLKSRDLVS